MPQDVAGDGLPFRRFDPVCDRFEQAWRDGARPRLEDYLAGEQGAERAWLLRELLLVDRKSVV